MANESIFVARMTDAAVLQAFRRAADQVPNGRSKGSVTLFGGGNIQFEYPSEEPPAEIQALEDTDSFVISRANLSIKGVGISFIRGGTSQPKSAFMDEFQVSQPNQQQENITNLERIAAISSLLDDVTVMSPDGDSSSGKSDVIASHMSVLSRLEKLNEKLVRDTDKYRKELDREHRQRTEQLDEEVATKKAQVDTELENKLAQFTKREEELEKERSRLDDSTNTFARRQIRRDILDAIKKRQTEFKLTGDTQGKRKSIAVAMCVLFVFFGALTVMSYVDVAAALKTGDVAVIVISLMRQLLYSLGAFASVLYFIRWQNQWAEQHASAEFQVKQFELDMERASWIVESGLEWKKEGTDMPPELVKTLSNGLFDQNKSVSDTLHHPADQLASALLGTASAIKLKTGDSVLEIDPKKLRKSELVTEGENAKTAT